MTSFVEWLFQNRNDLIKGGMFVVLMTMAIYGCSDFNRRFNMKNDNPIEQKIEEVIKEETGVELDLTPDSFARRHQKDWKFQVDVPIYTF